MCIRCRTVFDTVVFVATTNECGCPAEPALTTALAGSGRHLLCCANVPGYGSYPTFFKRSFRIASRSLFEVQGHRMSSDISERPAEAPSIWQESTLRHFIGLCSICGEKGDLFVADVDELQEHDTSDAEGSKQFQIPTCYRVRKVDPTMQQHFHERDWDSLLESFSGGVKVSVSQMRLCSIKLRAIDLAA